MMKKLNKTNQNKARGFTLIELLVVVTVLAALAGMTSVALDGYQQDAEEKLTRVEMQRIANAIRRFKEDTGYWPKTGPFSYNSNHTTVSETAPTTSYPMSQYRDDYFNNDANLWWLFHQPPKLIGYWDTSTDSSVNPDVEQNKLWPWSYEVGIGWNGPYINLDAIKIITTDAAQAGCSTFTQSQLQNLIDKPHSTYPDHIIRRFNGLVDRFQQTYQSKKTKLSRANKGLEVNYCPLTRDDKNMQEFKVAEYSGSPYLYRVDYPANSFCPSAHGCIVLQSFGANGIEESNEAALNAEEIKKIDDIIFILQVNKV